ncbi:MAG TPA: hypothetical protein VF938_08830 [Candidatus Angelobacter sp.]
MKPAVIGVRVHSGWGALVAVAGQNGAEEIIERRKVIIIDAKRQGAAQPYHYVEELELPAAERHLAQCAIDSKRLAREALDHIFSDLLRRGYALIGAAILLSSARPLPDLDEILASHALIHTAEGESFRQVFRHAFESMEVPVTGISERELDERAQQAFGKLATHVRKNINGMGRILGPPWTQDEKTAALAAAIVLAETRAHPKARSANARGA